MSEEVRFGYLRPKDMIKRREECPIAYIPLGILEWHGFHNPLGVDSFTSEHLAVLCAKTGGGLAMPPLHWGYTGGPFLAASSNTHQACCQACGGISCWLIQLLPFAEPCLFAKLSSIKRRPSDPIMIMLADPGPLKLSGRAGLPT